MPGVKKPVYSWMYWKRLIEAAEQRPRGRAIASRIATAAAIRPTRTSLLSIAAIAASSSARVSIALA